MGQADAAVKMLKGIGYVTVRMPRANLSNVKVTKSTDNETKIIFEGNQKLVFGIKAVQMVQIRRESFGKFFLTSYVMHYSFIS